MKSVMYLIHIPGVIVGFICGTIFCGLSVGFDIAVAYWYEKETKNAS